MSQSITAPRALLVTHDQMQRAFEVSATKVADAQWAREQLLAAGAVEAFSPPAIGEYWPGQGGIYDGQVREADGTIYHQIHADVKPPKRLNHGDATKWAGSLSIDGHSDFVLPTRRGAALLYANLADRFEKGWHWTSETYAGNASYAWSCHFYGGDQLTNRKGYEGLAVAVRRFVL